MKQSLILLGLAASASAFTTAPARPAAPTSTALFGGARGGATTLEGKKSTVAAVKELLDTSEMVFTVPASGISVSKVQSLRRSLRNATTVENHGKCEHTVPEKTNERTAHVFSRPA